MVVAKVDGDEDEVVFEDVDFLHPPVQPRVPPHQRVGEKLVEGLDLSGRLKLLPRSTSMSMKKLTIWSLTQFVPMSERMSFLRMSSLGSNTV
jgi:hypothetical protein